MAGVYPVAVGHQVADQGGKLPGPVPEHGAGAERLQGCLTVPIQGPAHEPVQFLMVHSG